VNDISYTVRDKCVCADEIWWECDTNLLQLSYSEISLIALREVKR